MKEIVEFGLENSLMEVAAEVASIANRAEDLAKQIICKSIIEIRPVNSTQQQMEDALNELQSASIKLKKMHNMRPHHSLVPTAEYSSVAKLGMTEDAILKAMIMENKDIFDEEAIRMDPKTECVTKIESKLVDLEYDFWSRFKLTFKGYLFPFLTS